MSSVNLTQLQQNQKTTVPTGAGVLISVPDPTTPGARDFDQVAASAIIAAPLATATAPGLVFFDSTQATVAANGKATIVFKTTAQLDPLPGSLTSSQLVDVYDPATQLSYKVSATAFGGAASLATPSSAGIGKPDNVTLTIDGSGTYTVISSAPAPLSSIAAYVYAHPQVYLYGGIGDGSAHTIGTAPSGHILAGVTTLAQLAAVQVGAVTPFAFVTQAPFTASTWALTDAKVSKLDLDWLAIQACLWMTGEVRLPKGTWIIGSQLPLPLLIRSSTTDDPSVYGHPTKLVGEGQVASIIKAGSDFGVGLPLLTCGDPTASNANGLGRYAASVDAFFRGSIVAEIGLLGPTVGGAAYGSSPCQMTGFAWGTGTNVSRVQINWFAKGLSIVGDGHGACFERVSTQYCGYGVYWEDPSPNLYGDTDWNGCSFAGLIGALGVHPKGTILGATFIGKTYLNAPYGIFAESSGGGADAQIINSVRFEKVMVEWIGNAFIHDENGFQNGVYGTGAKRDIATFCIESIYTSYDNSKFWGGNNRGRVAWIDCHNITNMVVNGIDTDASQYAPSQGPSGPAPIALFRVRNLSADKGGISIRGPITSFLAGIVNSGVPLVNGDAANGQAIAYCETGDTISGHTRVVANTGANPSVIAGDVIEVYSGIATQGGRVSGAPVIGVAAMPGNLSAGVQTIPITERGAVVVLNAGVNPTADNVGISKCTGVRSVTVTGAGLGGTPGNYTDGAFNGGNGTGAAFNYTIKSDGTLDPASVVMTAHGTGYISAPNPTFGHGLSGFTAAAVWPSGLAKAALPEETIIGWSSGGYYDSGKAMNVFVANLRGQL